MEVTPTAVLNQLARGHSENMAYSRFFNNDSVSVQSLINSLQVKAKEVSKGKHVLGIYDTSEVNKTSHRKIFRKDDEDIGPVGNNFEIGFYIHPMLLVDTAGYFPLGISNIHCWNRKYDKKNKNERSYKQQPIEDKESYRWITSGQKNIELLGDTVSHLTIVGDRESDIYEEFIILKSKCSDVLVRSRENRMLYGENLRLYEYLALQPLAGTFKTHVRSDKRKNREGREAEIEVRYCIVKVQRPKTHKNKNLPEYIELTAIEAKESSSTVPNGEKPIIWRLLTTHYAEDVWSAITIITWYKTRWLIEELFRLLKHKGIDIESSQIESGKALKKLTIMALYAALRILQLRQDRDGLCSMQDVIAFTPAEVSFAEKIYQRKLKGKTKLQMNPYKKGTLARMGWVIARLGGWKGYNSTALPGPITYKRGLDKFNAMFQGHIISISYRDVYKE